MILEYPEDREYQIVPFNTNIHLKNFNCDDDLNIYFKDNAWESEQELINKNYCLISKADQSPSVLFCVSNGEIKAHFDLDMVIAGQHYKSYPAIRIGRFATHKNFTGRGLGSKTLDFIKLWFTSSNKTGCRFIVVDSRNDNNVLNFYKKNDFIEYPENNLNNKTLLLYYDLKSFNID
jgi:GNAT superfamily N-acetyltransferase